MSSRQRRKPPTRAHSWCAHSWPRNELRDARPHLGNEKGGDGVGQGKGAKKVVSELHCVVVRI
jgi:hypothetical protein